MNTRQVCALIIGIGLLMQTASAEEPWRGTLGDIGSAIVSIQVDVPLAFETSQALNSEATGFVVDAERGLILTNRHVIQAGPVSARAIFANQEEIDLTPVYRDPIHDFGIFRYDPSQLRDIEPVAIALRPDKARVGTAIRLIGNDAGERFSILDATLARLTRNTPDYGDGGYNDFNTFYLQASSAATGGSSGSPVLNADGEAIGLQAAGRFLASTNYYLPLDRIVYALEHLQRGAQPARGGLLATFEHASYDQLSRLGLQREALQRLREDQRATGGGLVVERVQAGGPADGVLRPGDVLLAIDDVTMAHFLSLAEHLDHHVGETVSVLYSRGGEPQQAELKVVDLQTLMPQRYLDISDAVIHPLSYQQARHLRAPVQGLVLTSRGFMFRNAGVGPGALIESVDGQAISTLDELISAFERIQDGKDFRLGYRQPEPPYNSRVAVVTMDRRWHPARQCQRQADQHWSCAALDGVEQAQTEPAPASAALNHEDPQLQRILRSMVRVSLYSPFPVDGENPGLQSATGLVVDAEKGLVMVDRDTVPVAIADIYLTFAGSLRIPAEVAWLHPLHNLALLRYDPALLGDTPVSSAPLADTLSQAGDQVRAVGLVQNFQLRQHQGAVLEYFPLPESPRRTVSFTDRDLMVLTLEQSYFLDSGVFLNQAGEVTALIASYNFGGGNRYSWGIPIDIVRDLLVRYQQAGNWRSLEVDLRLVGFDLGRRLGVPEDWLTRIDQQGSGRRELLQVDQVFSNGNDPALAPGDLLLAIDDQVVDSFRAVERASQRESLQLTVLRDGEVTTLQGHTMALASRGTESLLLWAGSIIQPAHRALRLVSGQGQGLYIHSTAVGSPAQRAGVASQRLLAVNEQPVDDLESFIAAVQTAEGSLRLRLKDINGRESLRVVRQPEPVWAFGRVLRHGDRWQYQAISD
jgi:S1-C subfamily serine protease